MMKLVLPNLELSIFSCLTWLVCHQNKLVIKDKSLIHVILHYCFNFGKIGDDMSQSLVRQINFMNIKYNGHDLHYLLILSQSFPTSPQKGRNENCFSLWIFLYETCYIREKTLIIAIRCSYTFQTEAVFDHFISLLYNQKENILINFMYFLSYYYLN
jgi:hypothetical protein